MLTEVLLGSHHFWVIGDFSLSQIFFRIFFTFYIELYVIYLL